MIKKLFCSLALVLMIGMSGAAPALAYSPFGNIDCSGAAGQSTVCKSRSDTSNPIAGPNGLILKAVRIIAIAGGLIAIIIIIVSGLQFVTSGGDAQKAANARNGVIYAAVGLMIIILAAAIVSLVVGHL